MSGDAKPGELVPCSLCETTGHLAATTGELSWIIECECMMVEKQTRAAVVAVWNRLHAQAAIDAAIRADERRRLLAEQSRLSEPGPCACCGASCDGLVYLRACEGCSEAGVVDGVRQQADDRWSGMLARLAGGRSLPGVDLASVGAWLSAVKAGAVRAVLAEAERVVRELPPNDRVWWTWSEVREHGRRRHPWPRGR